MRRILGIMLVAALPVQAMAQDAVIRIEAKRGPNTTAAAVEAWQTKFPDVVTFPLPGGWTAIALGPMDAEAAATRLAELKAAGAIPGDSFVAAPGGDVALTPAAPVTAPEATAETSPQMSIPQSDMDPAALIAPPPGLAAPTHAIRLEAFQDRAEADAALTKWRETFPGAGLWQLPNGWFAIALAPVHEDVAKAWVAAFKQAGRAPKDAFAAPLADMGTIAAPGELPDLPAPQASAGEMPPLDQVQRALRWAGYYDGGIDGKTGPKTREAIAAEIADQRLSADPGTAMRLLIERRADWQRDMGLIRLDDTHTGIAVTAPMDRLTFDRTERALSIYGPKDGSGAALILFSQPGGQQELLDLAGLVTALGWVPTPERQVSRGHVLLTGGNDAHLGHAEGWVRDGRAEGYVLIWPASEQEDQVRLAAELSDSFTRTGPAATDPATETLPAPEEEPAAD